MDANPRLTPLILLVDHRDDTAQDIEGILGPKGYVVVRAPTGQAAIDLAGKVSPDAVLVDVDLPDIDAGDLARTLHATSTIDENTPILMLTAAAMGRARRLDVLGAGAWDLLTHPVDPNEMVLRLDTFVRAKRHADRVREEALTDPGTGLYNVRGLVRRTKEISADAVRAERPLTCLAFGIANNEEAGQGQGLAETGAAHPVDVSHALASVLRAITRISDTIGRLGPNEFVVVAPGTDESGAVRLVDRVLEAVEAGGKPFKQDGVGEAMARLRAGFHSGTAQDTTSSEDLLLRATMALRRAQSEEDGAVRIKSYRA